MFYVSFRPVVLAHSHNLLSLFCTSSCGSSSSKLEHKYCNCANLTRTNQIKLSLPLFKKTIIQWAQVEISRRCMSSVDKYSINTNRHQSSRRVSVCHIAASCMMMVSMQCQVPLSQSDHHFIQLKQKIIVNGHDPDLLECAKLDP